MARYSLRGMGSLRKNPMFRESRKARLNSFAHHRASMLFTFKDPPQVTGDRPGAEAILRASLRTQVRAALLLGKSATASAAP